MPRRPRIHVPGSLHHVTAHSVESSALYRDDHDRWRFVGLLDGVTRERGWRLLAFCLMETHYHFLVEERDTPLSRSMRLLNGRYAAGFNERHDRNGHLFGISHATRSRSTHARNHRTGRGARTRS